VVGPRVGVSSAPTFPPRGICAPPRLTPLVTSATTHRIVADLRFPGELVHARATEYAHEARLAGMQHTLKLWRECCYAALIALARLATAAPAAAICESLSWQLDGEDYLVSVVLARPAPRLVH
jgi:hypothetical protein